MKGIYLTGPNNFSLQELNDPEPGKNDALIKVRMAGICGSDVHLLRGRNPFAAYPLVPGHEYMGEILQAPKGRGLRKGDRVTVFPEVGCGKCPACKEGRLVHCPEFKFVGVRMPGGCFCEKLAVPCDRVIKLPKAMKAEEGAMVEPAAVAVHAVQRGGVKRGDRVVVIGGGTIGLLTAQAARAFGASKIVVSEPISERRKNHYYSTLLRADAMRPLHLHQVNLLAQWRKLSKEGNSAQADSILFELLRCINAIAGAIGYTG